MLISQVNCSKICQEFNDAGISWEYAIDNVQYEYGEYVGDLDITFPMGTDMILVQSIIDSHDTAPFPTSLTDEEKRLNAAEQELQQLREEKETLSDTLDMVLTDLIPNLLGGE